MCTLKIHLLTDWRNCLHSAKYNTHCCCCCCCVCLSVCVTFQTHLQSDKLAAPPSYSPRCLRFGHRLTMCTLKIRLLTDLLFSTEHRHGNHWQLLSAIQLLLYQTEQNCVRRQLTRLNGSVWSNTEARQLAFWWQTGLIKQATVRLSKL